jgi:hypothetical protein
MQHMGAGRIWHLLTCLNCKMRMELVRRGKTPKEAARQGAKLENEMKKKIIEEAEVKAC